MPAYLRRLLLVALAAGLGFAAGCAGSAARHLMPWQADYPFLAENVPLPHHVPEHAGGASFRFAMAHDVIHERFPKHGPAHYQERNRLARAKLATLSQDDPAAFPLVDDLAVGLGRFGNLEEATELMRDKLARQRAKGMTGRDLYSSYANLGTFLMLANIGKVATGDPVSRHGFEECLDYVHKSVEVNPEAHFGRERWQLALGQFLLAAADKPDLLVTYDFIGNRLDRELSWTTTGSGRAYDTESAKQMAEWDAPDFFRPDARPEDPDQWPALSPIRMYVRTVGAEKGWSAVPSHLKPVPFDEPLLGIIGMWRQGGGANPHFALAIGETMIRVGQRHIAWSAFERAHALAHHYGPDWKTREFLREHCRRRQAQIEETLTRPPSGTARQNWQNTGPALTAEEVAAIRTRFEAELAHGEGYQRAYQEYEAAKIAAGVPITDEHFYDEFHAGREPIASPVGPEEWFSWVSRSKMSEYGRQRYMAWGAFGAGLGALLAAGLIRRRRAGAASRRSS